MLCAAVTSTCSRVCCEQGHDTVLKAQERIPTRICCPGIRTQFFQLDVPPLPGWVGICCLLSMAFCSTLPTAAHSGELRRRSSICGGEVASQICHAGREYPGASVEEQVASASTGDGIKDVGRSPWSLGTAGSASSRSTAALCNMGKIIISPAGTVTHKDQLWLNSSQQDKLIAG